MKERIIEFLKAENKSSAQLAEEIGVQPSGISHILSGRNNPSLDFILKMLEKYPFLSTDWLLFGKGTMYKDGQVQSLFDDGIFSDNNTSAAGLSDSSAKSIAESPVILSETDQKVAGSRPFTHNESDIVRIIWFFNDNSFEEYHPRS